MLPMFLAPDYTSVLLLLASLMLLDPCHVVDTHAVNNHDVDCVRCCHRSCYYNVSDVSGDPALAVVPALAGVLKNQIIGLRLSD